MSIFMELTPLEEREFREFVDDDETTRAMINKWRLYHPVVRHEIAKRLLEGTEYEVYEWLGELGDDE
jgi:hypothetical protein